MANTDTFIPDVWNEELQQNLEKALIYDKWAEKKYEGQLQQAGDQVRIFSIGQIAVKKLDWSKDEDRETFENNLGTPQKMTGGSITLTVNQIAYYQIRENDIEKKLAKHDLWDAYQEDSAVQIKDEMDSYVASFADGFPFYKEGTKTTFTIDVNNILNVFASMQTALLKKNVAPSSELKMEVPFDAVQILKKAYEGFSTDNAELLKSGKITNVSNAGTYYSMIFEGTNNCYKDESDYYHLMLRTKRALAFVKRVAFSETVRNGNGFSNILRGYALYDAKVVRANEGISIKAKFDTTVEKYQLTKAVASA